MNNKLKKPARVQVEESELPDDRPPQTGTTYNIWYLNWSGGDRSKTNTKLQFRVNIKKDSGYTKGDKLGTSTICLFFARGQCIYGKNCKRLHRLPTEEDYYPPTQDCFGRDRSLTYKDDMSGPASFTFNTTIYISGLNINNNTQLIISKHFGEFGKIEKIKILKNINCAFLTYSHEYEAQFAQESMQCQSLDGNEILRVRWANEDPNPVAQRENKRKLEERTMETVKKLLKSQPSEQVSGEINEIIVEEPSESEDEIAQPEPEKEVKQLPSPSLFNKDTLSILSKLKHQKLKKVDKPEPQASLADSLGYSSDSD